MSRESESEQTRRTVAELLAQYGGDSGEVTPRRRRRRAEDASDTAPQAIIDRVNSDSGRLLPVRDDDPPPVGRRAAAEQTAYTPPVSPEAFARPPAEGRAARPEPPRAEPPRAEPYEPRRPEPPRAEPPRVEPPRVEPPRAEPPRAEPPRAEPPPAPPFARGEPADHRARLDAQFTRAEPANRPAPPVEPRRRAVPAPIEAEETRQVPPIVDDYPPEPPRPVPPKPDAGRANLVRPPAGPPQPPVREPVTEVLPRIADALTPNVPLESLPTESVLIVPPAPPPMPPPLPDQSAEDWFGDESGEQPAVEPESTQFHQYVDLDDDEDDADFRRSAPDDEPAGLGAVDLDDEEEAERNPGKEWLVMLGQLAAGVIGGAALWLGFNFLWRTLAPAALVVALVVTVGLVLVVRRIRRADDLQTTVLAVLVGLIVTVSPAAMLLVKS